MKDGQDTQNLKVRTDRQTNLLETIVLEALEGIK